MSYVITSKEGFDFFKELGALTLNREEAAQLIEGKEVIEKLMRKIYFKYQIDLMQGKMKGNEGRVYVMGELMKEVSESIKDLDLKIQDYKQKEEESQT